MNSFDGVNWTIRDNTGTGNTLYGLNYDFIYFMAVGVNGTIVTSKDGVIWTDYSADISETLYGSAFTYGIFVVVGEGGVVLTTSDLVNWIPRSSGVTQTLRGVAYGDNRYVAVGDGGVILNSIDGIDWDNRDSVVNNTLLSVVNGDGMFVVVGENGRILTGSDVSNWKLQTSGVRNDLFGVVYGDSRFVGVGAGEIVYSICDQNAAAANVDNKNALKLKSPDGEEVLNAGEKFLIAWESEPGIEKVKLEYSPDNGTTYLPIAVDVDNIGHYEWLVPHHVSSHCLVRVSEVKERRMLPHGLFYELDFRVDGDNFSGSGEGFTIYLGDAINEGIRNNLPGISFLKEVNGKTYIQLNDSTREINQSIEFNSRWHNIQVFMDNVYDKISVILDGTPVFENIPRSPTAYFSPALSLSVGPGNRKVVEIDVVSVKAFYSQEDRQQWFTLFNEDFDWINEKKEIEKNGWRTNSKQMFGNNKLASGIKHLTIQSGEDEQVTVVKLFSIPMNFPFDVSDRIFEIRYNDSMNGDMADYDAYPGHGGGDVSSNTFYSSSPSTISNNIPGKSRTTELINTYYIYTYDGKLLAEYDHNGTCVRDYIYAGNRLIAEYKPQTGEYFYYMTDQINSTRIITDGSGNVVFSEAYGPYGDVQKTWTNTYDPKLKFSGKEREGYSDLDYFGARYYDHKSFRFNSVDPIINKTEALYNPQLWNLYAYCRNNPITYFDPDGRSEAAVIEAGKTLIPLFPLIAAGGPYAAAGTVIITGVIIGMKAHEAGYPAKTAREYESDMMRSGYDALFGNKTDNVILSKGGRKAKRKSGEHTKNARPSTEGKHQKGRTRAKKDYGGEKGDARRRPQRRRKKGEKGPYPPKKDK